LEAERVGLFAQASFVALSLLLIFLDEDGFIEGLAIGEDVVDDAGQTVRRIISSTGSRPYAGQRHQCRNHKAWDNATKRATKHQCAAALLPQATDESSITPGEPGSSLAVNRRRESGCSEAQKEWGTGLLQGDTFFSGLGFRHLRQDKHRNLLELFLLAGFSIERFRASFRLFCC
jgi:hypothetical protein